MRVKKVVGCKEKRVYNDQKTLDIYNVSICGDGADGDEKWLVSTLEEQTKKTCAKTLGLLAPPSDIEVQEECIQMEEIEMQHRIH
jgi:hypothetical protein